MDCPKCGYVLTPFEKTCPRCHNFATNLPQPVPPLPSAPPDPVVSADPVVVPSNGRRIVFIAMALVTVLLVCGGAAAWMWLHPVNRLVGTWRGDAMLYFPGKAHDWNQAELETWQIKPDHTLHVDRMAYDDKGNITTPVSADFKWYDDKPDTLTIASGSDERSYKLEMSHDGNQIVLTTDPRYAETEYAAVPCTYQRVSESQK